MANKNRTMLCPVEPLWQAADKTRGHMDLFEAKSAALGFIFLQVTRA